MMTIYSYVLILQLCPAVGDLTNGIPQKKKKNNKGYLSYDVVVMLMYMSVVSHLISDRHLGESAI